MKLPIEAYDILESKFGRAGGRELATALEALLACSAKSITEKISTCSPLTYASRLHLFEIVDKYLGSNSGSMLSEAFDNVGKCIVESINDTITTR